MSALGLAPTRTFAQGAERTITGRVVLARAGAARPVRDASVVLHRVAPDTAGPIDSMRTRVDGSYRFRYRATGDTTALYFVSTSRGGVAYFTPPVRDATVRGDAAELVVYDTTSLPIPIRVRARHVIVTAPDSADRRGIVEVYELSNDTTLTRVAQGRSGVTFDAPLPRGVTSARAGDGDVSVDALKVNAGRVEVSAPMSPGLKRLSFYYDVPATAAPIELLVEAEAPVIEVLVEDANAVVEGAGLVAVESVTIEGRQFRRYLAQDVPAAEAFSVTAPSRRAASRVRFLLILTAVGAALLLGLGAAFLRGGPAAFARRRVVDPEALALEIAALDARFEAIGAPTPDERAAHYLMRARLKGRLSTLLAKRDELA